MASSLASGPTDPYHDHGDWKGPCGDARHNLILAGGTSDQRTFRERARYTLGWVRYSPEGLSCACCRAVLVTDLARIHELEDNARAEV